MCSSFLDAFKSKFPLSCSKHNKIHLFKIFPLKFYVCILCIVNKLKTDARFFDYLFICNNKNDLVTCPGS